MTLTDASKVWMPDTFFRNEKIGSFHNILTPNLYIRVFPDGDVLYSIRISLTCFCSMYLALFPLDEQTCNLDIASCKFTQNQLIFRVEYKTLKFLDGWAKSDVEYVWKDGNPVQLANNLSLPGGFKLGAFGSEYCDVVTATGKKIIAKLEEEIIFFAKQKVGQAKFKLLFDILEVGKFTKFGIRTR